MASLVHASRITESVRYLLARTCDVQCSLTNGSLASGARNTVVRLCPAAAGESHSNSTFGRREKPPSRLRRGADEGAGAGATLGAPGGVSAAGSACGHFTDNSRASYCPTLRLSAQTTAVRVIGSSEMA